MIEPTLAEIIRTGIDARLLDIHTATVAKVMAYYSTGEAPCVDAKPVERRPVPCSDGSTTFEDLPVIPCVPVLFPRSSGYSITFPITPGDFVLLCFLHSSLDGWRDSGQDCNPTDQRRHSLGSCIAIPGVGPQSLSLPTDPAAMVITGQVKVDIDAANYVALDNLVRERISDFVTAFCNASPTPNDGGAAIQTAVKAALTTALWGPVTGPWSPPSVACTTLKAK